MNATFLCSTKPRSRFTKFISTDNSPWREIRCKNCLPTTKPSSYNGGQCVKVMIRSTELSVTLLFQLLPVNMGDIEDL